MVLLLPLTRSATTKRSKATYMYNTCRSMLIIHTKYHYDGEREGFNEVAIQKVIHANEYGLGNDSKNE